MEQKGKRYTEEFKALFLNLLKEGRSKKSLEREYGVASVTIREWEKKEKGTKLLQKKYQGEDALHEIIALRKSLEFEKEKNKILQTTIEEREKDIEILKKASAILMKG